MQVAGDPKLSVQRKVGCHAERNWMTSKPNRNGAEFHRSKYMLRLIVIFSWLESHCGILPRDHRQVILNYSLLVVHVRAANYSQADVALMLPN